MSLDRTNANTALAGALVDELARAGCRRAVISPGSRSTPVSLALARHPRIEISVVLDERVAGFVALGIGLAGGMPAPVSCTSGSAAANLHPAVVEADQAGVPMVVLTSDRPPELRGIGAGQTIDQIKLYGSAVRWFCEVGTHAADDPGLLHYRAVGARAAAEAVDGRGPVHLNLAWRDPLGPEPVEGAVTATGELALSGREREAPITSTTAAREPVASALDRIAESLGAASRPLIIAGRQRRPDLPAAVCALAERLGAPLLAEPTSGLRYGPHPSSHLIASYDLLCRELPSALRPDHVLRLGDMPTSKPLRKLLADPAIRQTVVVDGSGWNEPTRIAGELIRADPPAVALGLAERLDGAAAEAPFLSSWWAAEGAAQKAVDACLGTELSEPAIHRSLHRHLPRGSLLLASSMPIRDAESFAPLARAKVDALASRGANGIDGLTSTALGIAIASGEPTVAVLGDLATLHDLGGLLALGASGVDLRLLVINNGGGRIFEFLPQRAQLSAGEFERLFLTPAGVDFADAARLAGIPYARIESIDGLEILSEPGPRLVEAAVDPAGNVELHRTAAERVGEAVGALDL